MSAPCKPLLGTYALFSVWVSVVLNILNCLLCFVLLHIEIGNKKNRQSHFCTWSSDCYSDTVTLQGAEVFNGCWNPCVSFRWCSHNPTSSPSRSWRSWSATSQESWRPSSQTQWMKTCTSTPTWRSVTLRTGGEATISTTIWMKTTALGAFSVRHLKQHLTCSYTRGPHPHLLKHLHFEFCALFYLITTLFDFFVLLSWIIKLSQHSPDLFYIFWTD